MVDIGRTVHGLRLDNRSFGQRDFQLRQRIQGSSTTSMSSGRSRSRGAPREPRFGNPPASPSAKPG